MTPDGKTVYAAAFFSGNQTTTVVRRTRSPRRTAATMPGPATITLGGRRRIPQPPTGLVVKYKAGPDGTLHWLDAYGTNFDASVNVTPARPGRLRHRRDREPARRASASGVYAHVGTTLFNMAVNPKSGKVYVSNTDAHNDVRFEGHTPGFTSVAGNIVDSRITRHRSRRRGAVTADNLNPHLDHAAGHRRPDAQPRVPAGPHRLAPTARQLYVVAQGSSKLAIYDTAALEAGTVDAERRPTR